VLHRPETFGRKNSLVAHRRQNQLLNSKHRHSVTGVGSPGQKSPGRVGSGRVGSRVEGSDPVPSLILASAAPVVKVRGLGGLSPLLPFEPPAIV